jgi:excisionase family DNA binding protein
MARSTPTVLERAGAGTGAAWPAYATISTACALLGLSRRTVYELLGRGELTAVKRGSSTLVNMRQALAYLDALPPAKIKSSRKK